MNFDLKMRILKKFRTQWEFAQSVVMHESDISRVISGRRKLSQDAKKKWSEVLGCRIKEIFNGASNR
jgi:hypothetical protein